MDIIRKKHDEFLKFDDDTVAVMGQFDGLHIGHVSLIKEALRQGKENNMKVAVVTFDPHPDFVLRKRENMGYITPLTKKLKLLEDLEVDYVVLLNFDIELSQLSPEEFHERFLTSFQIIVVGSDYRYGFRGKGNTETLKTTNKKIIAYELLKTHDKKIGSNMIREYLIEGRVQDIYSLLNRYYSISGVVSHGSKVGRTLGIHTANIELEEEYQIIKKGVYVVYVTIDDEKHLGVCNIGINPSINTLEKMRLEVHILDFDHEIYDKHISIDIVERIRDEMYFDTPDKLVTQVKNDIKYTKENYGDKI